MKRKEKIEATWIGLMSMMANRLVTETIELYNDNYVTIARINCNPKDNDAIDAINFSKWLRNRTDTIPSECEPVVLFKPNHNVAVRINNGDRCRTSKIDLSKWLFNRTDTIANEYELAHIFAKTCHIVCKVNNTSLWYYNVKKFRSGSRYIEKIRHSTKDDERCGLTIIDKRRISRF